MTTRPPHHQTRIPSWLWDKIVALADQETKKTGLKRTPTAQIVYMLTRAVNEAGENEGGEMGKAEG